MERDEAKGLVRSWDHHGKTLRGWGGAGLEQHRQGGKQKPQLCSNTWMLQRSETEIQSCFSHSELQVCICHLWQEQTPDPPGSVVNSSSFPTQKPSCSILLLPGCSQHHTRMATPAQVASKSKAWHRFPAGKWIFHPEQTHSSLSSQGSLSAPPLQPPGAPQDEPHVPSDPDNGPPSATPGLGVWKTIRVPFPRERKENLPGFNLLCIAQQ